MGVADENQAPPQRPNIALGDATFFERFKREFTGADLDALYVMFYASVAGTALSASEILTELKWRSSCTTLAERLRKIAGKLIALRTGYELVAYGYKPPRWIFRACLGRQPMETCCWDIRIKADGSRVIVPLPGVHEQDLASVE
jgi:hypothetical protein